jgi:hypothetical protein
VCCVRACGSLIESGDPQLIHVAGVKESTS